MAPVIETERLRLRRHEMQKPFGGFGHHGAVQRGVVGDVIDDDLHAFFVGAVDEGFKRGVAPEFFFDMVTLDGVRRTPAGAPAPDLADLKFGSTGHSQGGQSSFVVLQFAEEKWGDQGVYAGLAM